jgi:hypothetical protein
MQVFGKGANDTAPKLQGHAELEKVAFYSLRAGEFVHEARTEIEMMFRDLG